VALPDPCFYGGPKEEKFTLSWLEIMDSLSEDTLRNHVVDTFWRVTGKGAQFFDGQIIFLLFHVPSTKAPLSFRSEG